MISSFTTAKGSVYRVLGSKTQRVKNYRVEHGMKDQGLQPSSDLTVYMRFDDAKNYLSYIVARYCYDEPLTLERYEQKLSVGEDRDIIKIDDQNIVVSFVPKLNLIPVEFFDMGNRFHFGNNIISVE